MRMREAGLLNTWISKFKPDARQCLTEQRKQTMKPLRLGNLSGAFVVLVIGILMSFTAFVGEKVIFFLKRTNKNDVEEKIGTI